MNRNPKEIQDHQMNHYISRSMFAYPSDKSILPLIIHLNIQRLSEIHAEQYVGNLIQCTFCHSFLNPYCIINSKTDNWKCSVCGRLNALPLPQPDTITSAFFHASKSICYNNSVFDVIQPLQYDTPHPKIIISIQSSLFPDFKNIISQAIYHNDFFRFSIILFDEIIQLFNFHSKSWHILSDIEKDDDFFFPTKIEYLFGTSYEVQSLLNSDFQPISYHKNISIEHVCHIVSKLQNTKLVLIVSGPILNKLPTISFPVSIVFYGMTHSLSICQFVNWSKSPTTDLFHLKHQLTNSIPPSIYRPIYNFLYKSLQFNFETDVEIQLNKPKCFEIAEMPTDDYRFYVLNRNYTPHLTSFLQFEIKYKNAIGIPYCRYINFRIPLSPDPRVLRSVTFPFPIQQAITTSSFFISCILHMTIKNLSVMSIRNSIMEMSYKYPMSEIFWPHFVYKLLVSDVLDGTLSSDERMSILLPLTFLPPPLIYLRFVPLQYSKNKLVPLFPKALNDATARVTESEIITLDDSYKNLIKLLNLNERDLLVLTVHSFPDVKDEEDEFLKWKHDWELSIYNYNYEKTLKRK